MLRSKDNTHAHTHRHTNTHIRSSSRVGKLVVSSEEKSGPEKTAECDCDKELLNISSGMDLQQQKH